MLSTYLYVEFQKKEISNKNVLNTWILEFLMAVLNFKDYIKNPLKGSLINSL